jgi:hypothetical protein
MCVISRSPDDDDDDTAACAADGDASVSGGDDGDDDDDTWWADPAPALRWSGVGCDDDRITEVRPPRAADDGTGVGVEAASVVRDESSRRWHSTKRCSMPPSAEP